MPTKEQQNLIFERIGYIPTPLQCSAHDSIARIKLVAGGERAGKSRLSASELLGRFYEGHLFWLVGQEYANTRAEFEYLCDGFSRLGLKFYATKDVDPGEILVENQKWRIVTKSAKDYRKLGGEAPDGILVCEAAQIDWTTFLRLRGRLAEKRAWMLLSGTFESSLGWYVEFFNRGQVPENPDFRSFSIPSWTNTYIFPGGRTDPEIADLERTFSKELFLERLGGMPCPPAGRVFTEFSYNIHVGTGGAYEFNPSEPVYLWIDPGFVHAYVVLVAQRQDEHIYIIDELYQQGMITSDIITVCKQKPWWDKAVGGAIDIASHQHQAMPAVAEIWQKEGKKWLNARRVEVRDGIEKVKSFLLVNPLTGTPRLHINAKCLGLISEMGGCLSPITGQAVIYKWKTNQAGQVMGDLPDDKNNHACKALAYGLVDTFGFTAPRRQTVIITRI